MATYLFKPQYSIVENFAGVAKISDLEKEVGVYSATPEFVKEHCGKIAISILDCVPDWYFDKARELGLYPNCDVRIHRLYPGDFPAYPGWHCDGEFRETYFSQPDLDKINVHHHLTATVSSHEDGVSNTQFLDEEFACDVEDVNSEHTLWGQVDVKLRQKKDIKTFNIDDGNLVLFDARTLHRCTATRVRGWRLFFRMSMWHKANLGDGGMITKQEQVYKLTEGSGW